MRNILTLAALYLITIVTFANATDHGSSTIAYFLDSSGNVSIGTGSLGALTTGANNIAIGNNVGTAITIGQNNLLLTTSESTLVSGVGNILLGTQVYTATAITNYGTAIGTAIKVGSYDVAVGTQALQNTATDNNANTAIGYAALSAATTGVQNTSVGGQSGAAARTGASYNTFLGYNVYGNALVGAAPSSNTAIGNAVGSATTKAGSFNILIGVSNAIDTTTSSTSNEIHIGGTGGDWITVTGTNTNSSEITIENGVHIFSGALSSVTSGATDCGTSPSIVGNDNAGLVTAGTSPSGKCTVTFAAAKTTAPICMCQNNTSNARGCGALTVTTSTMALTATTSPYTAADKIAYHCFGYQK